MSAGIGAADAAIYTGVCVENNDPAGQGRIRFCVPQLSGTASFGWAVPVVSGYTAVGSNVFVAFEGGDRNHPVFWPDQTSPRRFATFAELTSQYNDTNGYPDFGATFWVDEYGGWVQRQTNGLTTGTGQPAGAWQWLPSGYQNSNRSYYPPAAATGPNSSILTSTIINNPSEHRAYKISASANVFGSQAGMQISLGFLWDTSPLADTYDNNRDWGQENVVTNPGLSDATPDFIFLSSVLSGFPTGTLYFASYIINRTGGSTTATTSTYGWYEITVEDVGAQ